MCIRRNIHVKLHYLASQTLVNLELIITSEVEGYLSIYSF